jgi:hypothetical protein
MGLPAAGNHNRADPPGHRQCKIARRTDRKRGETNSKQSGRNAPTIANDNQSEIASLNHLHLYRITTMSYQLRFATADIGRCSDCRMLALRKFPHAAYIFGRCRRQNIGRRTRWTHGTAKPYRSIPCPRWRKLPTKNICKPKRMRRSCRKKIIMDSSTGRLRKVEMFRSKMLRLGLRFWNAIGLNRISR